MEIPERYKVLGPDELARELSYRPAIVHTHPSRKRWDKIPQPSVRLATGPIWYLGGVDEWKETIRRGQES